MSSELLLPIVLTKHPDSTWKDNDNTLISFDGFNNVPSIILDLVNRLDPKEDCVIDRKMSTVHATFETVDIYEMTNQLGFHALYRAELINAALQYSNPDMYFCVINGPLLVEHDEGYIMIASVSIFHT